jgi:hypothetical protein
MKKRGIAFLATLLGAIALALPVSAAGTSTTFTLAGGSLSVSVPTSKDLGSVATGTASISGQLGTVTVTDNRGVLLGSWSASVSSTDFTTGGATSNETIDKGKGAYWSGNATATSGTATFVPGQLTSGNAQDLSVSRTAFSASAIVGNNSASWNPTVTITIPSGAVAGTYTGTITHSVA